MGKHDKKTGKGRLDKFYKLAKEQGYRARSAFKLIHLNRKYDFLAKSKCAIDLCAAPGGWLQVAEKYMPKGSLIIGVDLNAIKPLPHCQTFVSDITTPHCRSELKRLMHDWKADIVMHDGAPNVGSAWVQDAFTQNELVLQSLKLATEFLIKGGTFVTKVFRSQDYNSLMWVFNQLFKTVEATKPPSSRNVSAEIFVVCQDFLAPKHIDPKFLDPKHVFKDIAPLPTSITDASADGSITLPTTASSAATAAARIAANNHSHANVFMPDKKRRNRDGYMDGDYTLFHKASATDFLRGADPVALLGTMNKIEFVTDEEKQWLKSRHTTHEIIANCEDLKVLGKGDFKALMKWRLAMRLELGIDVKAEPEAEETEEVTVEPMDEEEQISEELKRLHEQRMSKQRKDRKRKNEKKARDLLKLQLHMTAPEDLDNDDRALGGEEVFDLGEGEREAKRQGRSDDLHDALVEQDGMSEDEAESSEEEETDLDELDSDEERERKLGALEGQLDGLYDEYKERMIERDAKWKAKEARAKDRNYDSWHGIQDGSDEEDGVEKTFRAGPSRAPRRGDADEEEEVSDDGGWDLLAQQKAKLGEEADSSDSEDEAPKTVKRKAANGWDDDEEIVTAAPAKRGRGLVTSLTEKEERAQMSRQAQVWFDQSVFKGVGDLAALDGEDEEEEDADTEESDEEDEEMAGAEDEDEEEDAEMDDASEALDDDEFEIVPVERDGGDEWDVDQEDQDEVKRKIIQDKGLLTAEAVELATQLVNRQTTADKLINDGFNRLSTFNKDGLPSWFLDDESKFYKPNIPITKEAINALRDRQRALDARPIKKVAEAKARKKFKEMQRIEKAKRKADGVMEAEDLNMAEKARAVGKVISRAHGREKMKEKKIVVATGQNRGVKGRPRGVKGKYKIVDARMRKETRALKRIKKATTKKR